MKDEERNNSSSSQEPSLSRVIDFQGNPVIRDKHTLDDEGYLRDEVLYPPRESSDIPDYYEQRNAEWKVKHVRLRPAPKDQEIIDSYFEHNPVCDTQKQVVERVARDTGTSRERVEGVIKKGLLRERGKEQKLEITNEVYGKKIPLAEEIVGLSLVGLRDWVKKKVQDGIDDTDDAKAILSITTGLHNLLRLELGKSTQNVEVVQTVHRDVSVVLDDLRKKDPFRTYPVVVEHKDG